MEEKEKKPFYKRWLVWVGAVSVLLLIISISGGSQPSANQTAAQAEQTATQPQVAANVNHPASVQQAQPKQISYQIVDRWTIPNGGEGKVVVISPDLLNETDMVALGNKLKSDTQNDRNAFISVFDNASAAALRDRVLADKATTAEQNLYDKHFVGEYDKNINTGYHEFDIYFDGVMGTNQKTIKY